MSAEPGQPLRFFDAHCDTFLQVVEKGASFERSDALHVTLPGLLEAGVCAQVFAAWTLAERLKGREDEVALRMIEAVGAACENHSERLVLVRDRHDLDTAWAEGRIAAICALESADPLKGDPLALDRFRAAGVRLLTFAWQDNAFCGSAYGSGSGLTDRGRELVARCEQSGVMVDVSHMSDRGFWDVCGVATRPFVASHSNCRALCDNPRNLTDEMVRAVAERGGVIGVNLYSGFLSQEFSDKEQEHEEALKRDPAAKERTWDETGELISAFHSSLPRPPLSLVVDHVRRLIEVGGEDCVGLGGDLDGCDSLPQGVDGVADYPKIAAVLVEAGLTAAQVRKVCHENFARVFGEILP